MGRPVGADWEPLGLDSDPVPGDPQQIGEEAHHLSSVAETITSQVAMLRKIATSDDEVGKHAEKIRSSASSLADQLEKVVGRYQKVSSALDGWIPELEQAQAMSLQALSEAEAPYKKLQVLQSVQTQSALPSGSDLTAEQKQEVSDNKTATNNAVAQLEAAIALLNRATSLRDSQASYYAGLINSACDDAVKDSWWQDFENWVSEYAWLIKDICTALEVIGTILAILALIFTGVGWIVLLGVALTAAALVGRTMLAITGNGSWLDVALDAVALLSFGVGAVVGKMLSGVAKGMEAIADGIQTDKAAPLLAKFAEVFGDSAKGKVLAEFLEKTVPVVEDEAKTTLLERILGGGDGEVVNMMKTVANLSEKFADGSPEIKALADSAKPLEAILKTNFIVSNVVGLGGLGAGGIEIDGPNAPTAVDWHIPVIGNLYTDDIWNKLVDSGGLSTGTADTVAEAGAAAAVPEIPLLQSFRLAGSSL